VWLKARLLESPPRPAYGLEHIQALLRFLEETGGAVMWDKALNFWRLKPATQYMTVCDQITTTTVLRA